MSQSAELMQQIIERETTLHQPENRRDEQTTEGLLHGEFSEIGRSGRFYSRQDVVAALNAETDSAAIHAEEFALSHISNEAVMLTYQSFELSDNNIKVRRTWRSSLWIKTPRHGWQMRFHQGTPMKE